MQIAFLSFPQKDRFLIQAYVFLVASPLFDRVGEWLKVGHGSSMVLSFVILALMVASIVSMAKTNKSLSTAG